MPYLHENDGDDDNDDDELMHLQDTEAYGCSFIFISARSVR